MPMGKAVLSLIGTLLVLGSAGCTKFLAAPNDLIPGSQQGGIVEANGLRIRLPKDWAQMPVPDDAFAVAGSCDKGNISLLVEARPFDRVSRTAGLDKEIGSTAVETSIATFAGKKGHGFRRVGRARGGELSYMLFIPDAPSESIAILIVQIGRSDSKRTAEIDQIVRSIEIIPPTKKWNQ
jgi:hypothetical protein